jgi:NADPH2:quinone reductase
MTDGKMMRAAWYEKNGPADEVIVIGDLPVPHAGPTEVRVRLKASGVNPSDCNRRAGRNYRMEFPRVIPNSDGAGTVDQIGEGVPPTWLDKRVWIYNGQRGRPFGTAAEYITLPFDLVAPLPDNTEFEAGACLGIPAMTAHLCLFANGSIKNKTILVSGGAGAVGNYAIQMAKWAGAWVITTISSEVKAYHAAAAGADLVLNYKKEDVAAGVSGFTGGRGVDRIVEVNFGENLPLNLQVLKIGGVISTYASRGNDSPIFPIYPFLRLNATVQCVLLYNAPIEDRNRARIAINAWLETGRAIHRTAACFSLERTAEAHSYVEKGEKLGTVVVAI